MKSHPSLKECIIITCLFIAGIITVSFAQKTGKENIRPIVENALSQTIDTDIFRRIAKKRWFNTWVIAIF